MQLVVSACAHVISWQRTAFSGESASHNSLFCAPSIPPSPTASICHHDYSRRCYTMSSRTKKRARKAPSGRLLSMYGECDRRRPSFPVQYRIQCAIGRRIRGDPVLWQLILGSRICAHDVGYLLIAYRYDSRFTIHHLLKLIANCYYICATYA